MTLPGAPCAACAAAAASLVLADGARVSLRQVGAEDRDGLAALFARLSPQSRYRRFLSPKPKLTPRELTYFTDIDHVNHEAIAAVDQRDDSIVGVARYVREPGRADVAELAIEVADAFQRMGIGTALAGLTIQHGHANGLTSLTATTLWENHAARRLLRHHGFRARQSRGSEIEHELKLRESSPRESLFVPENPRLIARAASVPSASPTWNDELPHDGRVTLRRQTPFHITSIERNRHVPVPVPPTHAREARPVAPCWRTARATTTALTALDRVPAVGPHHAR